MTQEFCNLSVIMFVFLLFPLLHVQYLISVYRNLSRAPESDLAMLPETPYLQTLEAYYYIWVCWMGLLFYARDFVFSCHPFIEKVEGQYGCWISCAPLKVMY